MQITKLIELWNLPTEFEVRLLECQILHSSMGVQIICRDTWALHLSLLSSPPPPEPYFHAEEQDVSQKPDVAEKANAPEREKKKSGLNDNEARNEPGRYPVNSAHIGPDNEDDMR